MLYKLTDKDGRTYNETQWEEGITHTASGEGELCGPGWIHAYTDPLLAVLFNPIHGNFRDDMRLWECEGEVGRSDHGLKVGCTTLTTLREIPVPDITTEQRVRFGILCALAVKTRWKGKADFRRWAESWLDGSDRSQAAADAAAAGVAARAAAWAAAGVAAAAAWAAADIDLIALAHEAVSDHRQLLR